MATQAEIKAFRDKLEPYAIAAASRLQMPAEVILSQWAWESAYGTSELAKRAQNYGGLKKVNASIASGQYQIGGNVYAAYSSLSQFVDDYVRVMMLPYYNNVRGAQTIGETLDALGKSPYAESPYRDSKGQAGFGLIGVMQKLGLPHDTTSKGAMTPHTGGATSPTPDGVDMQKALAIGVAVLGLVALIKG